MKVWRQEDWDHLKCETVFGVEKSGDTTRSLDEAQCPHRQSNAEEAKKAREKAVYYLQFSGKTEAELRKKLAEQEFSPASVDSAIEFVKKYRYLDDEDYTRRFVERNSGRKSRKQILFELSQKGVDRAILDTVLEEVSVDEEGQILALLEKRHYSGDEATREERQKTAAYLARKGFTYDAIQSAMIQFARKN